MTSKTEDGIYEFCLNDPSLTPAGQQPPPLLRAYRLPGVDRATRYHEAQQGTNCGVHALNNLTMVLTGNNTQLLATPADINAGILARGAKSTAASIGESEVKKLVDERDLQKTANAVVRAYAQRHVTLDANDLARALVEGTQPHAREVVDEVTEALGCSIGSTERDGIVRAIQECYRKENRLLEPEKLVGIIVPMLPPLWQTQGKAASAAVAKAFPGLGTMSPDRVANIVRGRYENPPLPAEYHLNDLRAFNNANASRPALAETWGQVLRGADGRQVLALRDTSSNGRADPARGGQGHPSEKQAIEDAPAVLLQFYFATQGGNSAGHMVVLEKESPGKYRVIDSLIPPHQQQTVDAPSMWEAISRYHLPKAGSYTAGPQQRRIQQCEILYPVRSTGTGTSTTASTSTSTSPGFKAGAVSGIASDISSELSELETRTDRRQHPELPDRARLLLLFHKYTEQCALSSVVRRSISYGDFFRDGGRFADDRARVQFLKERLGA